MMIKAAYCDGTTQREYLSLISKTFEDKPYTLQTFEGGRTVNLVDYLNESGITRTDSLPVQIHMGTLIKAADPFVLDVDKKKKHNTLICGANEKMANNISNNYILSLLLNENVSVYCIDGDKLVGDDVFAEIYESMSSVSRFKVAEDRADIIRFINEVYQKYQSLKKQSSSDVIFVVIKNLQFLDIVKSMFKGEMIDKSDFLEEAIEQPVPDPSNPFGAVTSFFENRTSDDRVSAGEKLLKLISDGSGFGIHFVVTSLEYQTVRECMYYGENVLAKFPERIIFSLGENDADKLIENVSVAGLRDNTVYYTDGVKNTSQMKPYIAPQSDQIRELLQ